MKPHGDRDLCQHRFNNGLLPDASSHYFTQCWLIINGSCGMKSLCDMGLKTIWVRSRNCSRLVTWFCYQLMVTRRPQFHDLTHMFKLLPLVPIAACLNPAAGCSRGHINHACPALKRQSSTTGLILGLRPTNERRCYFVMASLIGWVQAKNQPCYILVYVTLETLF